MAKPQPLARRLRYALEGAAVAVLLAFLGALPVGLASNLGAALGGLIGPLLPVHRLARRNIDRALPDMSTVQRERTLHAMWRNLGRVAAEYPHLKHFHAYRPGGRIEVVGIQHLEEARASKEGGIFFSGHISNWEVAGLAITQFGIPAALVYRAPNNPVVDRIIQRTRREVAEFRVPKGRAGARDMVKFLRGGGHLAMLIDQKMNDGLPVLFFGREAMTAPALAELALKYDCPVWPVRTERLKGARFRINICEKMHIERTGDRAADVDRIMRRANEVLEAWIRENPAEWLWAHRRWPD